MYLFWMRKAESAFVLALRCERKGIGWLAAQHFAYALYCERRASQ